MYTHAVQPCLTQMLQTIVIRVCIRVKVRSPLFPQLGACLASTGLALDGIDVEHLAQSVILLLTTYCMNSYLYHVLCCYRSQINFVLLKLLLGLDDMIEFRGDNDNCTLS